MVMMAVLQSEDKHHGCLLSVARFTRGISATNSSSRVNYTTSEVESMFYHSNT